MKITLLLVGKTAFPYINEGIALYEKRLGHYINYSKIEIPELKGVQAMSREQIKEKEGELILKNIKNTDDVILLDERGNTFTSIEWAKHLEKKIIFEGLPEGQQQDIPIQDDILTSDNKSNFPGTAVQGFYNNER